MRFDGLKYRQYHRAALLYRGIAQSGSAPALGAGCREFKSLYPDQFTTLLGRKMLRHRNLFGYALVAQLGPSRSGVARGEALLRQASDDVDSRTSRGHGWPGRCQIA